MQINILLKAPANEAKLCSMLGSSDSLCRTLLSPVPISHWFSSSFLLASWSWCKAETSAIRVNELADVFAFQFYIWCLLFQSSCVVCLIVPLLCTLFWVIILVCVRFSAFCMSTVYFLLFDCPLAESVSTFPLTVLFYCALSSLSPR